MQAGSSQKIDFETLGNNCGMRHCVDTNNWRVDTLVTLMFIKIVARMACHSKMFGFHKRQQRQPWNMSWKSRSGSDVYHVSRTHRPWQPVRNQGPSHRSHHNRLVLWTKFRQVVLTSTSAGVNWEPILIDSSLCA